MLRPYSSKGCGVSAVDTLRDALFGNPPDPTTTPSREGTLAAFTELSQLAQGAIAGATPYATRAAFPASTGSNKLAVVTSDSTAANNGYWQDLSGGWTYLTALNAALKGPAGLLAAASNAQLDAGTDNTTTVTPAGLSHLGLTSATSGGPFRVIDFNGAKPIDDSRGRFGTSNAFYVPRTNIYTKRSGVQTVIATLGNADSSEYPGYAKQTFAASHQFFYIDLADSTLKSVTYASGALPVFPNMDTMIPVAMAVSNRLVWFIDHAFAEDIERPAVIFATPIVVEASGTSTIVRIPAFYYLEGTGNFALISPPVPSGFAATPKYFPDITLTTSQVSTIWHDQLAKDQGSTAFVKTIAGNGVGSRTIFKGVVLARLLNGAVQANCPVLGDAPGGQVANQFAYSRDMSAAPTAQLVPIVGSTFYAISNPTLLAMGLTVGIANVTADKRPSFDLPLPEVHPGCEFFAAMDLDTDTANDFGAAQIAVYSGATVRAISTGQSTLVLERQLDTKTARYTAKFVMPNFADIDRARIVGTNPNGVPLRIAGFQYHHSGNTAPYIRTTDIFAPLPVAQRMSTAEASLADVSKAASSGSFGFRGRPVSNPVSSSDIIIFGHSRATDGQGFANELVTAYAGSGRSIIKNAIAGQASFETALWAGKPGLVTTAFTLPADISTSAAVSLSPNPFAGTVIDPSSATILVDGVPCILIYSGGATTIKRVTAGRSRTIAAGALFQITSTRDGSATAAGSVPLVTGMKRMLVAADLHNDLYLSSLMLNTAGRNIDTRAGWMENILGLVNSANAAGIHALVCGETPGFKFLTDATAQANGASAGIGACPSDANSILLLEEFQWRNAWMAATFEGYVDLPAAHKAAGQTTAVTISGTTFDLGSLAALPDGIHGTDGGAYQTTDAATIKARGDALSW